MGLQFCVQKCIIKGENNSHLFDFAEVALANYTNEICAMMEKVSTMVVTQDKQGFYKSAIGGGYGLFDVLVIAEVAKADCSIKDIVAHFGVNRNIVNSVVGSLIKGGILTKVRGDADARVQLLGLTEKGRELHLRIENEKQREIEFMLSEATINEEKAILKFLSKYTQYRTEKFVVKPKTGE